MTGPSEADQPPTVEQQKSGKHQIKEQLEKNLAVAIISKALGLSIPLTDALISNLKIGETMTALDIAKSFMQLDMAIKSR